MAAKRKITAKELDDLHDSGADISAYVDYSKARRPGLEIKRVNVDFPVWMIDSLDREAERIGVPRQSVIKYWISERLTEGRTRRTNESESPTHKSIARSPKPTARPR
jgi:hypothetical protein